MVDFKYNFIERFGYITRVKFTIYHGEFRDEGYQRDLRVFSKEVVVRGDPTEEELRLEVLKEVRKYAKDNNQEVFEG